MSVMPDFNDLLDDLINGTNMNESVDDGELETEAAVSTRKSFPVEGAPSNSATKGVKDPVGVAEEACNGGKGCGTADEACKTNGGKGGCAKEACGTAQEVCKGGKGGCSKEACGSAEEACKTSKCGGKGGCAKEEVTEEACKTGGKGCGSAEEACNGGKGGCSKEACGSAEEACKTSKCGGKGGCAKEGTAEEACKGPNNCGGKGGCAKEEVDPMMNASDVASLLANESDDEDDEDDDDDEKEGLSIDDLEDEDDDEEDDDDEEEEGPDAEDFEGLEGLSDSDLDNLARDLGGDGECEDGECEEIKLDPSEERRADDLMQIAGTASLLRSEMNAEERVALLESVDDLRIGTVEGFFNNMVLNDLKDMTESVSLEEEEELLTEAKMYNKTTVRFSKQARLNQLFAIAVATSARAHNDSDYVRYKKASIIKKKYWRRLCQKYKSEAMKRMRVLFARLRSSKSPIVKKLGQKVDASNASIASVADQNK